LEDIKQVLDLGRAGRAPCATVLTLAQAHLADLDQRIEQLRRLRVRLGAADRRWQGSGAPPDCASTLSGTPHDVPADEELPEFGLEIA
jgi:DNA-binding transcriptional MerR regulator